MSGYRLRPGDRQIVRFSFDGKAYSGYAGESLAAALLANGVMLFGRSFKYHRPRGILGAGSEEPNALISVDRGTGRVTPNLRATQVTLYEGLIARSQNNWPSLSFDLGSLTDRLGMFFPAGFYNKTFMWPRSFWEKLYEPAIRKMAGLGEAPKAEDPDIYAASYAHCDVLIVGAGPAGIEAALTACKSGQRVTLIDEQNAIGGGALADPSLTAWLQSSREKLEAAANVQILTRTTAFGYFHDNFIGAVECLTDHLAANSTALRKNPPREKLWRFRAGEVVLAQGAIERPLVFAGNDVPGVMLASAAQTFLHRDGVAVGKQIVVMASHDSGWRVAFDHAEAGVEGVAIIDVREAVSPHLVLRAGELGITIWTGHSIVAVKGRLRVTGVEICANDGYLGGSLACDAVLMAGGWTPSIHLWSHSKGSVKWDEKWGAFVPDQPNEHCRSVGAGAGAWDYGSGQNVATLPTNRDPATIKAFVDFQNDVCAKDIDLAVREGFKSIEHVKRYTTNGMATDQGKTSNLNGLQIAARALGRPVIDVGLTTFRPPYTPQSFGALAGHAKGALFQPTRKTPIDGWAQAHGAVFEPVAQWRRARYFPQGGEDMQAAVNRECLAVRRGVGLFDASTLGKIEVTGPDAAEFLNRMYTNPWKSLAPGRCRYGLMLREDGFIIDDGVAARLADDRFHVTTTTGGAARVLTMMEDYLQTEWPDLDVWLTSTTEHFAVIAVQGPHARAVIAPLITGIDLSPQAFPHMAVAEGEICGVPMRLFRVSFTGELGFEINVPSGYGEAVWKAVYAAGQAFGITPYGTETMHVLRAEKGYIIIGQDTDGTVTPDDASLGWAVGKKKLDFVGMRALSRADMMRQTRKHLVGLLTDDPDVVLEEGAQIVADPGQAIPMDMLGHVTSSYWSATLGRSVALAMVAGGKARLGEALYVPMPDGVHRAKISEMVFYDKQGSRLHG